MKKKILSLVLMLAVLLASCAGQATQEKQVEQPLTHIRLPMGYIPSVQYTPFYVAVARGYYHEAGLEIEFDYSLETDGVALVGANELQFAVVSGEQVPLARAQGLPVVYVMAWWQDYPVAVAAMKSAGIKTTADLRGKKIGLPGLFGANYVGLVALLSSAGLKEEDVQLDSIGFNQVEALTSGREDAVSIYANNEPVQMRNQGYAIDVVLVADYVQLASNGLITNETTIANNPDLVRRMVQATMKGIADTIADPDATYAISKKFVEGLDQKNDALQRQVFDASLEFWKTNHLGVSDPQAWQNMYAILREMGLISASLDYIQAFSNDYVK
jgi:NitT/TauT family transport system substrate-binding protein